MILSRFVQRLFPALTFFAALGVLAMAASSAPGQSPRVVIGGSMSRIIMVPQEPGPVLRAAKDLQSDFAKVFGRAPAIVDGLQDTGATAILIAQSDHVPAGVAS